MNPFPINNASPEMIPHLHKVLLGEYDIPWVNLQPPEKLIVLDIGANCGAYSYWATKKWPGCKIYAYEPSSDNIANYIRCQHEAGWKAEVFQKAITTAPEGRVRLYFGSANDGSCSLSSNMAGQKVASELVASLHPRDLPQAHILKIDAEGVEPEVIEAYLTSHDCPLQLSLEFHNHTHRDVLQNLLNNDYLLCTGQIIHPNLGTLNYLHRSIRLV